MNEYKVPSYQHVFNGPRAIDILNRVVQTIGRHVFAIAEGLPLQVQDLHNLLVKSSNDYALTIGSPDILLSVLRNLEADGKMSFGRDGSITSINLQSMHLAPHSLNDPVRKSNDAGVSVRRSHYTLLLQESLARASAMEKFAKQRALASQQTPYTAMCPYGANECLDKKNNMCNKIHFDAIVASNTDPALGDCSYLNTCFKGKNCRYVHYHISPPDQQPVLAQSGLDPPGLFQPGEGIAPQKELTKQWIDIDIRSLDFSALGNFAVVIADPPWDIHTNTISNSPQGHEATSDEVMMEFQMEHLQDEGVFFLWVTGRAIDIGRKCLRKWGYAHVEELIWCKTNQLSRTICTGRTGHWLNHSKEHVLMGVKGSPKWLARRLDVDVLVSGTREKSHKPDELYHIAERMAGAHSRKLELFGGARNIRPGWLTIGNELGSTYVVEPRLVEKFAST